MSLYGSPNVQQLEAKGNVQGLIKALDYDQDASVRMEAAKALGRIGDSQAVAPLIARLMDVDGQVAHAAVEALGEIGTPAIQPLLAALKNEDRDMRQRAAEALGMIGLPAAGCSCPR